MNSKPELGMMVCVGSSSKSISVLKHARQLFLKSNRSLYAVYVETQRSQFFDLQSKAQLDKNLTFAESLGFQVVILHGERIAHELADFARSRNLQVVLLGRSKNSSSFSRLFPSVDKTLFSLLENVDIRIVQDQSDTSSPASKIASKPLELRPSLGTLALVAGFTLVAIALRTFGIADASIVLTLLMAVVIAAWSYGLIYSVAASGLAILSHSYFFSTPIFSFEVYNPQHLLAFVFMAIVGVVVGTLAQRLQAQTQASRMREKRLETLNLLSRELLQKVTEDEVLTTAAAIFSDALQTRVQFVRETEIPKSSHLFASITFSLLIKSAETQQKTGWGTSFNSDAEALVIPLIAAGRERVFEVIDRTDEFLLTNEKVNLIETLNASTSLALERVGSIVESRRNLLLVEQEKMRNILLHGLSHDLRTPLTVISGTAATLLESNLKLQPTVRDGLESIRRETTSIVHQVTNMLELTKLSTGALSPRWEWLPAEDVVFSCLGHMRELFPLARLECTLPETLTLCLIDAALIERALINLLENAVIYSPPQSVVKVELHSTPTKIRFSVLDCGPGVPDFEKKEIFKKFVRGSSAKRNFEHRGTGLGLAIVQVIVELHSGSTGVKDREGGGSEFWFELPIPENMPSLRMDDE